MSTTTTRHNGVWTWLATMPSITRLAFNFSDTEDGDTCIVSTDTLDTEYIDGSQARVYNVQLVRYLPLSFEANDTGNIDMQNDIEAIADWLRTQNKNQNFPTFPTGESVRGIRVLEDSAGYAIAQDGSMAKFMLPFAIDYIRS